jgi:hypothetical protein
VPRSFNTSGPCIPGEHYMLPPEWRLGRLDRAGLDEGWLVLFDLRREPAWADKLFVREVAHAGKVIRIVGC